MMSQTDLHAAAVLVVDVLDEDAGLADVEDSQGRTYQLPAEWLPGWPTAPPTG
ncbi:hypothetical protein ACFSC4_11040 [Deinococcus malanensis]|uniref:hypothetical protein n=1 Tax=Deinococcus malanensis TaxID=1706855 RepID=UPI003629AE65